MAKQCNTRDIWFTIKAVSLEARRKTSGSTSRDTISAKSCEDSRDRDEEVQKGPLEAYRGRGR
ncbi:22100_t:CDS:2 [Rhizophagus irregularis]|nr:22100_t:CDS:2 [Rhizophagus irregularis]